MSMRTYPAQGYLITMTQIRDTLKRLKNIGSVDAGEVLAKLGPENDSERLDEYLELIQAWLDTSRCDVQLDRPFVADGEEQAPELTDGEIYFAIDDIHLFDKTATAAHKELKKLNLQPGFEQWTVFG